MEGLELFRSSVHGDHFLVVLATEDPAVVAYAIIRDSESRPEIWGEFPLLEGPFQNTVTGIQTVIEEFCRSREKQIREEGENRGEEN